MATDMRAVWGRLSAVRCCGGDNRPNSHLNGYQFAQNESQLGAKMQRGTVSWSIRKSGAHLGRVSRISSAHSFQQQQLEAIRALKGHTARPVVVKATAEQIFTEAELAGRDEEADLAKGNQEDGVLAGTEENLGSEEKVEYNWETEWYPLYLIKEIPREAPLALTVFDRSLVLFYDGDGTLNCLEDRCPHRLAKLSEGQITDGRLECLYHGWQFRGDGTCAKLPQLLPGAKIPKQACARTYEIKESQGVVWVWMADKSSADPTKVPWFEHYDREGFGASETIHEMPYDYSILLENLLDPAHVPISHNRTDPRAKREDAQALIFEVLERSGRGFAGTWNRLDSPQTKAQLRFTAPCSISNDFILKRPKDGTVDYFSALFLCRPAGQGKSMLIARFGLTNANKNVAFTLFPGWLLHIQSCNVLEEDMGFLSSQNEVLSREHRPTKDLYLNVMSQDTYVLEFRKWCDKVGHGLPYYWGHRTTSSAPQSALEEAAPAGLVANASASIPSIGPIWSVFARDPTHRYFRHFVHCKSCRTGLKRFQKGREVALAVAALSAGLAMGVFYKHNSWRTFFVAFALLSCAASWACSYMTATLTRSQFRPHKKNA